MVKKIIAVATAFLMLCCMIPFGAFADVLDACPKCGERTYVQETGLTVDACGIGVTYNTKYCTSCRYSYYEWSLFGRTGYKEFESGVGDNLVADFISEWIIDNFGKDVRFTKFESGGGSTSGGGVGRPKGYNDDNGTPTIGVDGLPTLTFKMSLNGFSTKFGGEFLYGSPIGSYSNGTYSITSTYNFTGFYSSDNSTNFPTGCVSFYFVAPYTGYYQITDASCSVKIVSKDKNGNIFSDNDDASLARVCASFESREPSVPSRFYDSMRNGVSRKWTPSKVYIVKGKHYFFNFYLQSYYSLDSLSGHPVYYDVSINFPAPTVTVTDIGSIATINKQTNITINNDYSQTWNGNIYTDNSTNLTYIYPQYTTVNEKNETVTNISNTPIIYNNETKKYYTYDTVTNNYYYITYEQPATPTPSPSPSPAPTETPSPSESPTPTPTPDPGTAPTSTPKPGGSISTPETGKPGGDAGDTTGILAVLVVIRDNMIQGFLDIKAAFVAGFAELSANFKLAIENLNVNIQNIFNKKFPDQSTPETAQPTPTPSPEPTETPSPTEPPSPTPSPSPAPSGKPDGGGDTNNFWNIFIGGGSDDGTDGDHKGIFWALVSLILALIAFFTNLFAGVAYLFPFLPEGVVMTINTCLFVVFLFVIIKFIMRSK